MTSTAPLGLRTSELKSYIDILPGVASTPLTHAGTSVVNVLSYKLNGKMFALLSVRLREDVIVKCDPHLAELLREQYNGVGHRSHLDRRSWICVALDADVPMEEVKRLVAASYELVRRSLPRRAREELEARSSTII